MAMIAGPFTDEIVGILMGQERALYAPGALFFDKTDRCCWLDDDGVWMVDTVLKKVSDTWLAKPFFVQKFPEPVRDGFCLTEGDGTVWIPEFTDEEKTFLKNCGYHLVEPEEIRRNLRKNLGNEVGELFPLSCKTGVFKEEDVKTLREILKKIK